MEIYLAAGRAKGEMQSSFLSWMSIKNMSSHVKQLILKLSCGVCGEITHRPKTQHDLAALQVEKLSQKICLAGTIWKLHEL